MFGLFKSKKSMDELLLEALTPCLGDFDPMYDSYFQSEGENPGHAKLAWALSNLVEEENPHQKRLKTKTFLKNFFPYLQKKSRKIQDPGQFFRFLGLAYHTYDCLVQRTGNPDIFPHTSTKSLDLENSGIVTLASYLKKTTSFRPEIDDRHLDKAPGKKLAYLIETCASGNPGSGF